jgi:hypothetical protein
MTKTPKTTIETNQLTSEYIGMGIDENMSDEEILSRLTITFEQNHDIVYDREHIQSEIVLAKQAHHYLAALENPLLIDQNQLQKDLLTQKLLFAMKKEKELQTIRHSYFQTQLLFAVAIVILISCYSALWVQQNHHNKRLSNLHQIPAVPKAKF